MTTSILSAVCFSCQLQRKQRCRQHLCISCCSAFKVLQACHSGNLADSKTVSFFHTNWCGVFAIFWTLGKLCMGTCAIQMNIYECFTTLKIHDIAWFWKLSSSMSYQYWNGRLPVNNQDLPIRTRKEFCLKPVRTIGKTELDRICVWHSRKQLMFLYPKETLKSNEIIRGPWSENAFCEL